MKIDRFDTLRLSEFPNLLFVQVWTDEGVVGLGETFFAAEAVEGYIHEVAAPSLIGKDPRRISEHALKLQGYVGYLGTGAEARGRSAIDIALWDLLGKAAGLPLYGILGGAARDAIAIYNTCAGTRYIRSGPTQSIDNWGLPSAAPEGPYEDLYAFLHQPADLARELLAQGFVGMKIWPFDGPAERSGGRHITRRDLDQALDVFRAIRSAVASELDIMVELHGLWDSPTARRIIAAVDEFEPRWYEDPIRGDQLHGLAELARSTPVPLAVGESLGGLSAYRELCEQRSAGIVILDVGWSGGISEARKIAAIAEANGLPVALHDCTGPVVLAAAVHLAVHLPNTLIQEVVRAALFGWYGELVDGLPRVQGGTIRPTERPGLGIELKPELHARSDAHHRSTGV